ncbi:MAG: hypothetical protein JW791_03985 [Nanoarchaeota archaeon]|nr:hypothetical protein [Nanoarchaeota archaeon]
MGVVEHLTRMVELGYLLHGSPKMFGWCINPGRDGWVYATDNPQIAVLKAIYSNKGSTLIYRYFVSESSPLELRIEGFKEENVHDFGWVYLIPFRNGFENFPKGSWQFGRKKETMASGVSKVTREDVSFPVIIEQ